MPARIPSSDARWEQERRSDATSRASRDDRVRRPDGVSGGVGRWSPLGDAAWGGVHAHLTTGERVGSAVSIFFYLAAILVVHGRAAGRQERRYRWGVWALVVVLGIAGVANLASESRWENFLLAPVALALATLCVVVARGATTAQRRAADGPPTLFTPAH